MFKMDRQRNIARLQRMKNMRSKIKPIKTLKELERTYYLGCKDFALNFQATRSKNDK